MTDRRIASSSRSATRNYVELPLGGSPPAQRSNASEQLGKRKGLQQIVVGTGVQAANTIFDRIASGQHQDWRSQSVLAHSLQDLEPASAWKHNVQDYQIEGFGLNQVETFLARMAKAKRILLALQTFLEAPWRVSVRLR